MTRRGYRTTVPYPSTPDGVQRTQRDVEEILGGVMNGQINSVGDLTLTAGTTTTLNSPVLHAKSVIIFTPTNAAAAGLATKPYVSASGLRTATLTHSTATGSETFSWVAFG